MTRELLPLRFWDCRAVLSVAADDVQRARKAIERRTSDVAKLLARNGLDAAAVGAHLGVDAAAVSRLLEEPIAPPAVMLDTEDAIAPSADGSRVRQALVAAAEGLAEASWSSATLRLVRLPATDARAATLLLDGASSCPPDAIVLPKAEDPATVAAVRDAVTSRGETRLILLVETPRGVTAATNLADAAGDRLAGMMFGAVDYAAGAGLTSSDEDHPLVAWARLSTLNEAAAAGVPAIDGMTLAYPVASAGARADDARIAVLDGLARAHERATHAAALGMSGKLIGHPGQLLAVLLAWDRAFDGSTVRGWEAAVLSYAESAGAGNGVGIRDGAMVDVATDRLNRSLLRRAAAIGRWDPARAVALDVISGDEADRLGQQWSLR